MELPRFVCVYGDAGGYRSDYQVTIADWIANSLLSHET